MVGDSEVYIHKVQGSGSGGFHYQKQVTSVSVWGEGGEKRPAITNFSIRSLPRSNSHPHRTTLPNSIKVPFFFTGYQLHVGCKTKDLVPARFFLAKNS